MYASIGEMLDLKGFDNMIAIIDYDAGNIKSVEKALQYLGEETCVTRSPEEILAAEKVILPGVGAFGDAMQKLHQYGLVEVIKEVVNRRKPLLGICLGLQLLFESSEESPGVEGLGILKGKIVRFPEDAGVKIPHVGWNSLQYPNPGRLFVNVPENAFVYFVHSYYLKAEEPQIVTASAWYGTQIHASVERDQVFACQFHPEKSSETGLQILKNFVMLERGKN